MPSHELGAGSSLAVLSGIHICTVQGRGLPPRLAESRRLRHGESRVLCQLDSSFRFGLKRATPSQRRQTGGGNVPLAQGRSGGRALPRVAPGRTGGGGAVRPVELDDGTSSLDGEPFTRLDPSRTLSAPQETRFQRGRKNDIWAAKTPATCSRERVDIFGRPGHRTGRRLRYGMGC